MLLGGGREHLPVVELTTQLEVLVVEAVAIIQYWSCDDY